MKKLLTIALALALTLALLTACGADVDKLLNDLGNELDSLGSGLESLGDELEGLGSGLGALNGEPDDDGLPESDDAELSEAPEENSAATADDADEGSVAAFLAAYGMTEDDLKPEHFIEYGDLKMDGSAKAGQVGSAGFITISADVAATDEPAVRAWFEQVYGKLTELATDGKIYTNAMTMEEESVLEDVFTGILWKDMPGTMWAYRFKGLRLNVSTSYSYETGVYKLSIMVMGEG